jgi:hypothetical protein
MSFAEIYGADFWAENKTAGFLDRAQVKQSGKPVVTVDVKYIGPHERRFDGAVLSQQHEMKYRRDDLPFLSEGDPVSFLDSAGAVIRAKRFRVREAPYVPDEQRGASGYFRWALLTQI